MEDYLLTVNQAFVDLIGDEGLSRKIAGYVRDCMLLDVLQRLRDYAERVDEICREMVELLDDKRVCSVGLEKIYLIWKAMDIDQGRHSCSDLVAANGTDIILTSMSNHVSTADIQKNGCKILRWFADFCSWEALDTFLDNALGIRTIVAALALHPDDTQVQEAALSTFPRLLNRDEFEFGWDEPYQLRSARFFVEAGAIPLLFLALERHNTNDDVVCGALTAIERIAREGVNGRCHVCRQTMLEYKSSHPGWLRVAEYAARTSTGTQLLHSLISAMDQL